MNGNIQRLSNNGEVSILKFEKTELNLSGISTKTTSTPKIQETSSINILDCMREKNKDSHNCSRHKKEKRDNRIELNKRLGIPIFIPLIALISCFLLSSRKEKKFSNLYKYTYFFIGFVVLVGSEITVRYSGISTYHSIIYYLIPIGLLPLVYLFLIRTFKFENLL